MDGVPYESARVDFQFTENTGSKVPGTTWQSIIQETDAEGIVVFEKTSFSKSVGMTYRVTAEHPIFKYWSDTKSSGMIIAGKSYAHLFQFNSDE